MARLISDKVIPSGLASNASKTASPRSSAGASVVGSAPFVECRCSVYGMCSMGVTKAKSLSQRFLAESFANISSSARLRDAERTFCTDKAAGGEFRFPPDEVFASHVLGVARAPNQRGRRDWNVANSGILSRKCGSSLGSQENWRRGDFRRVDGTFLPFTKLRDKSLSSGRGERLRGCLGDGEAVRAMRDLKAMLRESASFPVGVAARRLWLSSPWPSLQLGL